MSNIIVMAYAMASFLRSFCVLRAQQSERVCRNSTVWLCCDLLYAPLFHPETPVGMLLRVLYVGNTTRYRGHIVITYSTALHEVTLRLLQTVCLLYLPAWHREIDSGSPFCDIDKMRVCYYSFFVKSLFLV